MSASIMSKMINGPITADLQVAAAADSERIDRKSEESPFPGSSPIHPMLFFRNLLVMIQSNQAAPAHLYQVHRSNIDKAAFPQKARSVLQKTPTGTMCSHWRHGRGQNHVPCTGAGFETEKSVGAFEWWDATARANMQRSVLQKVAVSCVSVAMTSPICLHWAGLS